MEGWHAGQRTAFSGGDAPRVVYLHLGEQLDMIRDTTYITSSLVSPALCAARKERFGIISRRFAKDEVFDEG